MWAVTHMPTGSIRTVLVITPAASAMLIVAVAYWNYCACDEYVRYKILQAGSITALGMLLFVTIYYYLELTGLPRLSLIWVSVFGWSLFILQLLPLLFARVDEK
jgi:hypothetical protein